MSLQCESDASYGPSVSTDKLERWVGAEEGRQLATTAGVELKGLSNSSHRTARVPCKKCPDLGFEALGVIGGHETLRTELSAGIVALLDDGASTLHKRLDPCGHPSPAVFRGKDEVGGGCDQENESGPN